MKKNDNGLSAWIRPEHHPFRIILVVGWLALALLTIAYATGWIRDGSPTDTLLVVIILAVSLLYLLFTFHVIRGYLASKKQWQRLTQKQQKEMEALLTQQGESSIHYSQILPLKEFLCVYSHQQPAVLFYDEISWIYTMKGKLPRSATAYAPPDFKVTNVDNYLIFFNTKGKKFICFFGNKTLELYQHIAAKTPSAIHGYSEEKRRQYKSSKK